MKLAQVFQHSVRVYAEDVDFMGIVYHANYLRYFERARTELLRQNNLLLSELLTENVLFAINEINLNYIVPAKLDDFITISTQITEQRGCSFVFNQIMHNDQDRLLCEAKIKVVCVDGLLKPKRLPNLFSKPNE